jgi:hypothetical protein
MCIYIYIYICVCVCVCVCVPMYIWMSIYLAHRRYIPLFYTLVPQGFVFLIFMLYANLQCFWVLHCALYWFLWLYFHSSSNGQINAFRPFTCTVIILCRDLLCVWLDSGNVHICNFLDTTTELSQLDSSNWHLVLYFGQKWMKDSIFPQSSPTLLVDNKIYSILYWTGILKWNGAKLVPITWSFGVFFFFASVLGSSFLAQGYKIILEWRLVLKVPSWNFGSLNALGQRTISLQLRRCSYATTETVFGEIPGCMCKCVVGRWEEWLWAVSQNSCFLDHQWTEPS